MDKLQYFLVTFALAVGTVACQLVPINKLPKPRIVGGSEAHVGQFAWQVGIISHMSENDRIFCGGSLISAEFVLTAAHCTNGAQSFSLFVGSLTISIMDPSRIDINTSTFIQHQDFNKDTLSNDIALIKLPTPVSLNARIKVIALNSQELPVGTRLTISGWGATNQASPIRNEHLKYVNLNTTTLQNCINAYNGIPLNQGVLCMTTTTTDAVCNGDSGGPAVIRHLTNRPILVGIVSFGHNAGCESGKPVGFTRVDYYRDWIRINSGV